MRSGKPGLVSSDIGVTLPADGVDKEQPRYHRRGYSLGLKENNLQPTFCVQYFTQASMNRRPSITPGT